MVHFVQPQHSLEESFRILGSFRCQIAVFRNEQEKNLSILVNKVQEGSFSFSNIGKLRFWMEQFFVNKNYFRVLFFHSSISRFDSPITTKFLSPAGQTLTVIF